MIGNHRTYCYIGAMIRIVNALNSKLGALSLEFAENPH